jgi:hypothetical protein
VFTKEGDCCPIKYDCSHLERRSSDKCYVNGHEYSVGDMIKEEDGARKCDFECRCDRYDKVRILCFYVGLAIDGLRPKDGCFSMRKVTDGRCYDEEVCRGQNLVTCVVNGNTYIQGESFYPEQKPGLSCLCMEGFKGEFVEPFCKKVVCATELRHSDEIKSKCAPIYVNTQSPVTSCNGYFRCQNDKDKVIKASGEASGEDKSDKSVSDEKSADMKCAFGNMLMNVGDELNQGTDYNSVCVKCVCEVPPTPTCRRLSDSECDTSKPPDFA